MNKLPNQRRIVLVMAVVLPLEAIISDVSVVCPTVNGRVNVIKGRAKYSAPSKFALKEAAVRKIGNILAIYYQTELIAQHRLSYTKKSCNVNPNHYRGISCNNGFDTPNTLFTNADILHNVVSSIDLSVYDSEV